MWLGALALAAHPSRPSAAESVLELGWAAPPGCPSGQEAEADVLRLARLDGRAPPHRLTAQVTIERTSDARWRLELVTELDGISGERLFSGNSCRAVVDASVLTLALILNPGDQPAPPSRSVEAPPKDAMAASASQGHAVFAARDREDPPARTEARGGRWLVGGHVGLQAGLLKNPGPVFAIGLGTSLGKASAWLTGSYAPPQDAAIERQPDVGARLWLASAAAFGCWTPVTGRVAVDPCLGIEVNRLEGQGFGVGDARHGVMYWTSGMLALNMGLPVGRHLTVKLSAIGLVPVTRPTAFLENIGVVHRPAAFATKLVAGVDFSLP
jgi:hypothetical protein